MIRSLNRIAAVAAVWALAWLPASAQTGGSGSSGAPETGQHGGSQSGSGATDQQGSTPGDQATGTTGTTDRQGQETEGQPAGAASAEDSKGRDGDRTFIMNAVASNMAEIELGRLASERAENEEVKAFGRKMVEDHTKTTEKLGQIAESAGLAAPHALKPEHQQAHERLSKLSGAEFDRAYMQLMVKEHRKDVQTFQKHAKRASDPALKEFASSTLPHLEQHYERARELERTVSRSRQERGTTGTESEQDRDHDRPTPGSESGSGSDAGQGTGGNPRPPQR